MWVLASTRVIFASFSPALPEFLRILPFNCLDLRRPLVIIPDRHRLANLRRAILLLVERRSVRPTVTSTSRTFKSIAMANEVSLSATESNVGNLVAALPLCGRCHHRVDLSYAQHGFTHLFSNETLEVFH